MKAIGIGFLIVIWIFMTGILALSIVGLFVICKDTSNEPSTWMNIGSELVHKL